MSELTEPPRCVWSSARPSSNTLRSYVASRAYPLRCRARPVRGRREPLSSSAMKVGIVVPYSWSFWGAVNEHAELQAAALRELGVEVKTIIGNDPPGSFTRACSTASAGTSCRRRM